MTMTLAARQTEPEIAERTVTVDGLRTRYLEAGTGVPALLLHGASLGSSADVFLRNLVPLARGGVRAIAFDQPGFGLTDNPADHSNAYRRDFIGKFADALGLSSVAFIAHSQPGGMAVQLALQDPAKYNRIIILGTGSLLPPLEGEGEARDATAQQRLERRMATSEPTLDDTRKLLEANLYHHELITPLELELRHARSIGKNFEAFVARGRAAASQPPGKAKAALWMRLPELQVPLLMIYGRNDRGHAAERAARLKSLYPDLNLHIVEDCKHLVPWDAADAVVRLAVPFLIA